MATNMNTSSHNRSNSVPSSPHPFVSQHDERLQSLKASSEATSSSSSSLSSLSMKLSCLHDLIDCTDKVLQLPTMQQALERESGKKSADELLEGSLILLDVCGTAKHVLLQSKESIQGLQSAFRRKRGGETVFKTEAGEYLSSRKNAKKTIQKALESFKGFKKGFIQTSSNNEENGSVSTIRNLKEAQLVTLVQLESLLSFIACLRSKPKGNKLTLVSKLMHQPKRVCCVSDESNTNEFEKVDAELQCLFHKPSCVVEIFQNYMEDLECCIKGLEAEIEHFERQLIRIRVSLLNIYNH